MTDVLQVVLDQGVVLEQRRLVGRKCQRGMALALGEDVASGQPRGFNWENARRPGLPVVDESGDGHRLAGEHRLFTDSPFVQGHGSVSLSAYRASRGQSENR